MGRRDGGVGVMNRRELLKAGLCALVAWPLRRVKIEPKIETWLEGDGSRPWWVEVGESWDLPGAFYAVRFDPPLHVNCRCVIVPTQGRNGVYVNEHWLADALEKCKVEMAASGEIWL